MSEIKGLKELSKALKAFPQNVQKNILRSSIRAAASDILKEARKNVPKRRGALRKSLAIVPRRYRTKSLIGFYVGPRTDILKQELISAGIEEKKLVSKNTGFQYSSVMNYGGLVELGSSKMAASPYLRPALESKADEVINEVRKKMSQRIDKEIERSKNA